MASTYSPSLRLELMATGDQSGTWGDTTNTNLGTLLEQAITGYLSVAQGDVANLTLTALNGATDQSRNMVLNLTGALTAARNVVVPTAKKVYLFVNSTTGGFALTIKTSGGTGIAVAAGTSQWVYCDGTNVLKGLVGNGAPDTNGNIAANNFLPGYTTTATAAGTTVLTVGSTGIQYFTGTNVQTVTLPVVSTLVLGHPFRIVNKSTGDVTVNSSGANIVATVSAGASAIVESILTTGTTAASWSATLLPAAAIAAQILAGSSLASYVSPAGLATERTLSAASTNLGLGAVAAANALTITLLGADGNAVSATNPVTLPFRNVSATVGTPSNIAVTTATSLVISSGSTLGAPTGNVPFKIWVVAFNDAGTVRLAAINATTLISGALKQYPLAAWGIDSSLAEGGAGAADSAQTFYTGTAVTSKAYAVLGYLEYGTGLATAGIWATDPTRRQLFDASVPLPGRIVQTARTEDGAVATGTTITPYDDTIPQSGEGIQFMTVSITPSSVANIGAISALAYVSHSGATVTFTSALFKDAVADAIAAMGSFITDATGSNTCAIGKNVILGATSSMTFKYRCGANNAGTMTFNGAGAARRYGGAAASFIQVVEISA